MTKKDTASFHRQVAEELTSRYGTSAEPPEGWREILAWHWEQAGAFAQAADAALEVAETLATRLDFPAARQWAERTLTLLERLQQDDRQLYELRAYALALAVLEFGGQYREGLDYARRMLRIAHTAKGRGAEARAQLAIGRMQREMGQLTAAENALQQARALAERDELGDLEGDVRIHLAKVHQLQGRHLEALQELELARLEHEQHDDKVRLARVFTGVGDIYRVLGASREAVGFYQRVLGIELSRGHRLGQAIVKEKIALALLEQKLLQDALTNAEESLQLREQLNDIVGQARACSVLGMIMDRLGRYEQALVCHERAYGLQQQTQNARGQGITLLHLGDSARALQRYALANEQYMRALELGQHDNDRIAVARALERLGDLNADMGDYDAAQLHWGEALKIREELHHIDEATALRNRMRRKRRPKF